MAQNNVLYFYLLITLSLKLWSIFFRGKFILINIKMMDNTNFPYFKEKGLTNGGAG